MDLARGLETLLLAAVVAALAPMLVALLPGVVRVTGTVAGPGGENELVLWSADGGVPPDAAGAGETGSTSTT